MKEKEVKDKVVRRERGKKWGKEVVKKKLEKSKDEEDESGERNRGKKEGWTKEKKT